MFEDSIVMVMRTVDQAVEVCKLDLSEETRVAICKSFSEAKDDMISEKEKVVFDGSYRPNLDEFLAIESFSLCDEIKDAIRDPIGLYSFQKIDGSFPDIQAIFVGEREEINNAEEFTAAFQRFRKDQYISTKRFNLFFEDNTFLKDDRFGISISDAIDCFFHESELQFVSYFFARQIFDLSGYYRSATDQEVCSFAASSKLHITDAEVFRKMADTWIRRKIAVINDSEVLENYSAAKIKSLAKSVGIDIDIEKKKIIIPDDKKAVKVILGFLDEEAYRGPFSQTTFLANSKRRISSQ